MPLGLYSRVPFRMSSQALASIGKVCSTEWFCGLDKKYSIFLSLFINKPWFVNKGGLNMRAAQTQAARLLTSIGIRHGESLGFCECASFYPL